MRIEYFLREINGWICLDLDEYINLILKIDDSKIKKIKSMNNIPIKIIYDNDTNFEKTNLKNYISGNYVETLIKKELNLTVKNKKKIIITTSNKENNKKIYEIWAQAKIISYDSTNNILFLEYNEELILIDDDNTNKIRPLSKPKILENDISIYYIKKITNTEYDKFKLEYEILESKIEEEKKYLLYQNFDSIKSSLLFVCPKNDISNFIFLKEFEDKYKYKLLNNDDTNANSGITSRSGRSKESDKYENKSRISKNSNIIIDEDYMLNEINKYEYKKSFVYNSLFQKDAEKDLKNIIKKNKYYIIFLDSEEFKIIIYGNNENDFNEEINYFDKEYKSKEIKIESYINIKEMTDSAKATNIKYIYFGKQTIYLIGEEKSIYNFKVFINMNEMYSKELVKSYREKDNIQKQLSNFKKQYKIK